VAYTFWKYKWAYSVDDPAVRFEAVPGRGYYNGYSATGAYRGAYLKTDDAPTAVAAPPAVPEPENQKWSTWGHVIPISMGQRRMSPQVIWLRQPVVIGVTATADFAVSWGYNADDVPQDTEVSALYADGTRIWTIENGASLPGGWSWTLHRGTESQGQDSTMVAALGADNVPAYRGQTYGVFRNFPLERFGNKLPGISAEIVGSGGETPRNDSWNPADKHERVVITDSFTITKVNPDDGADSNDFYATGVRSRTYHRKGQYYYELTLDKQWRGAWYSFSGATGIGGGFSLGTASLTQSPGSGHFTTDSVGAGTTQLSNALGSSTRLASGSGYTVTDLPQWDEGDTIGLHINMDEGYVRARVVSQGGAWSSPAYYVAPQKVSFVGMEIGDPIYAHASVALAPQTLFVGYSDQQTVNFGAKPFLGSIPAGATAWNGNGGTADLLGVLPLRDFISKIATYCGLNPVTDLDFEGIEDVIHGGIITRDTTFSDFLTVLGRAYGFDYYEGETIRIVRRVVGSTYSVDKAIPPEDLIVETDRSIETARRKDDSPIEIELSYIDRTQQFRWNIQKARRILYPVRTTQSTRKDAFAIPVITTAKSALTLAGRALYREAMQNVDHQASMMPRHLDVEPSDILTITAGDTEYTVKVTEMRMEADGRLSLSAVNLLTDEDMEWDADSGSPNLPYAGNIAYMDATEGADTFFATQLTGYMLAHEGADGFAGSVNVLVLAVTDAADTFAGSGIAASMGRDVSASTGAGAAVASVGTRDVQVLDTIINGGA
jgi:hypothetical protein